MTIIGHEADGTPIFPPSYSFRLIGEVRMVPEEIIREKAKKNRDLVTAVNDMEKYPAMKEGNFVIYKAKGEIFDVDFDGIHQDHKLLRMRFSYGRATYNQADPRIVNSSVLHVGNVKMYVLLKRLRRVVLMKLFLRNVMIVEVVYLTVLLMQLKSQ